MKVLVAYDGSPHADAAIRELKYAGLSGNSEIMVVAVANDAWPPANHTDMKEGQFDNPWNDTMKKTAAFAENAANQIRRISPEWKVYSEPLWGEPAEILLKTIDHWKPDLLVVGSHGRNAASRLLLGSVSLELVRRAPCSVRVTRLPHELEFHPNRILVATDGSEHADAAVHEIAARHWPADTEVTVLAIFDSLVPAVGRYAPTLESGTFATEPAFQVITEADDRLRAQLHQAVNKFVELLRNVGLIANGRVIEGNALTQIVEEARIYRAGTVFVGARGLGALDRLLLGSVSSAVVTHTHCTVEVVRRKK
jgi:nucleotide-binding universal stress UspA family protein